jgi:DNA helicase-2/ATP-dependent DNA helicase PcrA
MGKKKLLFSQQEMRNFRVRYAKSKDELFAEALGKDKKEIEALIEGWEREKEEKREKSRILRKEQKAMQTDLFPEEREKALWKKSIEELSASKLATYRGCPLAFRYNYIEHVTVPQSPSKIFGKEIHYMLESFHKKNFKSVETFLNTWNHRWWGVVYGEYGDFEIAFKTKEQPANLCWSGRRLLRPFYEHNKSLPKPNMVEKDFSEYKIDFAGIRVTGKWDRVDRIEDKTFIIDYKTDFFSPEQDTFLLHRLPQFTFYAVAWTKKFGEIPHLALHHLRSGKVFKTRRTEEDFAYLEDIITKTKARVLEGDFTPFYGFHCNMCDFKVRCGPDCVGLGSKLKKREQEFSVQPEILETLSYNVPEVDRRNNKTKEYERKGDFMKAYYSLLNDLKSMQCPLETKQGALACLLWDEESPIRLPDPEIDN